MDISLTELSAWLVMQDANNAFPLPNALKLITVTSFYSTPTALNRVLSEVASLLVAHVKMIILLASAV